MFGTLFVTNPKTQRILTNKKVTALKFGKAVALLRYNPYTKVTGCLSVCLSVCTEGSR